MTSGHRLEVVEATSTMSAADPTRSRGISFGSGAVRFPGLTSHEAERVARELDAFGIAPAGGAGEVGAALDEFLVRVDLPAILSDGAGPHLLDADGQLTLALGEHPTIAGARVAMGEPHPGHAVGLVAPESDEPAPFLWRWLARRDVSPEDRVRALEEVHDLESLEAVGAWASGGPGRRTR